MLLEFPQNVNQNRYLNIYGCNESNSVYTISAETYGRGIDMWIRSQGERIENYIRK